MGPITGHASAGPSQARRLAFDIGISMPLPRSLVGAKQLFLLPRGWDVPRVGTPSSTPRRRQEFENREVGLAARTPGPRAVAATASANRLGEKCWPLDCKKEEAIASAPFPPGSRPQARYCQSGEGKRSLVPDLQRGGRLLAQRNPRLIFDSGTSDL